MNPLQIEYFSAVAFYKSFTTAAEELHVSQPAVSKQIAALEDEFQVQLFLRKGRTVLLTPAGELYYNFFRRAATDFENTKRMALRLTGAAAAPPAAHLAFFIDWDSSIFLSPLLDYLGDVFPQLQLDVENRGIYDIASTMVSGKFDATICFDHLVPEQYRPQLNSRHLADVHRVVFYSRRHPLAHKANVTFPDFRDEVCVALYSPKHPEPTRTIRQICDRYGFEPKFKYKPNHDSVIMSVQGGRGYCILDEWSRNMGNQSFRTLTLDYTRPVSVYWQKENTNPAIPIIVEALLKNRQMPGAPIQAFG